MKKIVSLLVVLILILSMIISCSAGTEKNDGKETSSANEAETTTEEAAVNKLPDPKFTIYNLNGRAYNILVPPSGGWVNSRDFLYFAESAGEPVNDAVQARIIAVEEMYNCVITPIYAGAGAMIATARKEILADGNAYDLLMPALTEVNTLAGEGLLLDLFNIKPLNLEMPWWSQGANENLSILGKLYYTMGDISLIDNDGIGVIIFNKAMITDNSLPNPYQHVYDNIWTLDNFYSICRGMSRDINGDGKMDKEDQYGFLSDTWNIVAYLYYCGESLVKKNADDTPYPSINNERVMSIIDKVIVFFNDQTAFGATSIFGNHLDANVPFMNNQILFRETSMFRSTQIREMQSDFGFIPPPKYNEAQEKYYNTYSYASPGIGFPVNTINPDENGAVLEALAYYGRSLLLPAYYEINLQTKITRDEDSPIMLEMIFDSGTVDLGFVYNFGNMREMFLQFVTKNENTFPSVYVANENKMLNEIEKLINTFKEIS